jgi:PAS domain S-box-containing protein
LPQALDFAQSPLRLVLECVLVFAVIEMIVMWLLPRLAPHSPAWIIVTLDVSLVAFCVVPLLYWRVCTFRRQRLISVDTAGSSKLAWALTIAVLLVGSIVAHVVGMQIRANTRTSAKAEFDRLSLRLIAETERRLKSYEFGLRGARGPFIASHNVQRDEFRAYVQSRELPTEFPGAFGFGFIQRVKREDLASFIASQHQDDCPDYNVRTVGNQPDLCVVKFIEPLEQNAAALGYDVGSEAVRRDALNQSLSTGEATLTSRIQLVQDRVQRAGFLYLLPVYRNGTHPVTAQQRRDAAIGWVYAPIIIELALSDLEGAFDNMLDLEVFDSETADPSTLLFDPTADHDQPDHMFESHHQITIGGRTWLVRLATLPKFENAVDGGLAVVAIMVGMALTILLSALVHFVGMGRSRALSLARDMTSGLRASEQRATKERIAAEEAAINLATFKTVVSESALLTITDAKGVILDVNDQFCALSGYTREELIGNTHDMMRCEVHPESFWEEMWAVVRDGGHWRGEICNRRKDGSFFWVDTTVSALRDHNGNIENFIAIRFDITERKQAEFELAAARAQLQSVLDSATEVSIIAIDTQNIIQVFSRGAEKLLGYQAEEVIGKATPDLFHDREEVAQRAAVLSQKYGREIGIRELFMIAPQEGAQWNEWTHTRKDGSRTTVQLRVTQMLDPNGKLVGHLGTAIDISDRKKVEAKLMETSVQAEAANHAKSEFLANMSHEIRTPLTAILGYSELLRDDLVLEPGHQGHIQTIDTIRNAGNHLLTVINDILDLSKVEAGKMSVENVEMNLGELLCEVESLMRPRASEKGIELSVQLATPIPSRIHSDPTRLRQMLLNMVGNAVKFTEHGAVQVDIRALQKQGSQWMQVDINDTGSGMNPRQIARLFEPFSQADSSVSRRHGGTGLGLIICRRLAELMGGSVRLLRTEPGKGSTFRIELPLMIAPGMTMISSLQKPSADAPPDGKALDGRILLADDGIDSQRLVSLLLRKAGASVTVANDGEEALRLLRAAGASGFDLLLTDMQMPGMDGYTLATRIREQGRDIPVIALTAFAMSEDRQKCIDAGCDDFITKPINRSTLIETCRRWLTRKHVAVAV